MLTPLLQAGDRVAIHPDSPWYQRGLRTGTVVSVDETMLAWAERYAVSLGVTSTRLREMFAEQAHWPPGTWEFTVSPVVRVDPGGPFEDAIELPVNDSHLLRRD